MKKTVKVNEFNAIDLQNFVDFVDISKVKYYKFILQKNKSLVLKFYDKNKRLIKLKQ